MTVMRDHLAAAADRLADDMFAGARHECLGHLVAGLRQAGHQARESAARLRSRERGAR